MLSTAQGSSPAPRYQHRSTRRAARLRPRRQPPPSLPRRQLSPDLSKLESLLDTDRQVVMELFFFLMELQRALPAYLAHDKRPEVFTCSLAHYVAHQHLCSQHSHHRRCVAPGSHAPCGQQLFRQPKISKGTRIGVLLRQLLGLTSSDTNAVPAPRRNISGPPHHQAPRSSPSPPLQPCPAPQLRARRQSRPRLRSPRGKRPTREHAAVVRHGSI